MRKIYVDNNSNTPNYPKFRLLMENKLKREKYILSRMTEGSNNYKKQSVKIAKLNEKVENQHINFFHKKSRELVNQYKCVCIESLTSQDFINKPSYPYSKYKNKDGWNLLLSLLRYKLREQGKYIQTVNKWFASSQKCHICGYKNKITKMTNNKKIDEYTCPKCGTHHNRDINAAINIKNRGLELLRKRHH